MVIDVSDGGAAYFVVPTGNIWGTTLDIVNRTSSLNKAQSVPNADGTYTYVLSRPDPGVHNWIDPCGMGEGILTLRMAEFPGGRPNDDLSAKSRVVPLSSLRDELPAETKWVTDVRTCRATRRAGRGLRAATAGVLSGSPPAGRRESNGGRLRTSSNRECPRTRIPLAAWLITGCSSGIGRHIALAALAKGHASPSRRATRSAVEDIVAEHPDQAVALALDVTDRDQVAHAVREAERAFGGIDVLVNNAGYGYMAAVEEGEDEEVRAMFDTNYFGVVDMIKATLPGMRRRGSGRIINISSMTGLIANPPNIYYSSTKFALEALTEGLAKEVAPFGIRVTAIEPGAVRTDWSTRSMKESGRPIEAYAESVGARKTLIKAAGSKFPGDPRRVADAVVMLSELDDPPLHLLLGRDVFKAYREKLSGLMESVEEWKSTTLDIDFPPD